MRRISGGRCPSAATSVNFESPQHLSLLLNGLNDLRSNGQLFDVTLIAGGPNGHRYEAHRVVLSACSDYFRAMFTDPVFMERKQKEIVLNGVTSEGLHHILEFAYTSRLALNLSNIQEVLSTASHVQMQDVVQACSDYLEEQIVVDNCVDLATIADTYSLWQLNKKVYYFICSNLMVFSQTNELDRLTFQQLTRILDCDYPVDCSESDILSIVMKWVELDVSQRVQCLSQLLPFINYKEITKEELTQHWNRLEKILSTSIGCHRFIYRKIFSQIEYKSPDESNVLINSRGMELAVIKVGGFSDNGVTNDITYYLESEKKWKYLSRIPHVEQCNFGMTIHRNQLYVVGGCFNSVQSLEENVHPFGFKYNPLCNNSGNPWSTIAPMHKERCRFTLTAVANYLYAIGGASDTEFPDIDDDLYISGEIYFPETNDWGPMASLPVPYRSQHSAVAYNHYIYISGGLDQDIVLKDLIRYNTITDEYDSNMSPMLCERADHTMIVFNNKIYVFGGWFEAPITGLRVLANTIDCYDILNDSWSVIADIPTPRYYAGIVNKGSIVYIIGGFHSDNTFDRTSGLIESFDLVSHMWNHSLDDYPQDIWEHQCCTLFVPKYRDDLVVTSHQM
ncbi:kelch-like protein 13 [Oppia nitens]|uniref:kelch-like protein 13 n=1 Tax=Oppia nitens TaxID=1686743 RepID=UPI0023DB198A|nr:kelch-like protein 13 [Oppia nitens]